jgi:hypothetical protein
MKNILQQLKSDNIPIQKQVELLAKFLIENFEEEISESPNSERAIEMAIRLLIKLKEERQQPKEIPQLEGTWDILDKIKVGKIIKTKKIKKNEK